MNSPESQFDGASPTAQQLPLENAPPAQDLTADLALAALKSLDLPSETVEQISKNTVVVKSRKVRFALAAHPRTPLRIALRLVRELYSFELLRLSLLPSVQPNLKRIADELLVSRLPSATVGERISLARRGTGAVAAVLLLDRETRVWQAALENPRLTESSVVKALLRQNASPAFVLAICHLAKWTVRPEIQIALLRSEYTPLAIALKFGRRLSPPILREVLYSSHLPEKIKACLRRERELEKDR